MLLLRVPPDSFLNPNLKEIVMYDIIIIGAGPAGLTAAVYARRAGKEVLVIEKSTFGGQMTFSPKIENYPGFSEISGNELADRMVEQAIGLGAEIDLASVSGIQTSGNGFIVKTDGGDRESKAVIIAAGAEHRRLGLDGEDSLVGNGISFCAVCDGAFFSGKRCAVIGGGNSAAVEASLLADICSEVTVIQNLPELTCDKASADALLSHKNVKLVCETVVTRYIKAGDSLSGITIRNLSTGEISNMPVDGCFIAIGLKPGNEPFSGLVPLDRNGYIEADESTVPMDAPKGIFVAGDCRTKMVRQISTAAADGAVAALAACSYVDSLY